MEIAGQELLSKKSYTDPLGNELLYEVCRFTFDRVELLGELEVMIKGENSLEIVAANGDLIVATPLDISGGPGGDSDRGKGGAGGWAGGDINGKGLGPGGGLPGVNPGGGGYGGAGSGATFSSGQPYGDGMITHLIGGSGGGGFVADTTGGGGGGALRLVSGQKIILNSLVSSTGGGGMGGSAGGSGGALHLKAHDILIQSKGILDVAGGAGGGGGGRIFLESNNSYVNEGIKNIKLEGGDGSVVGTPGTLRILRPSDLSELDFRTGTLTVDTDSATMLHSNGQVAYGIIEDRFYQDEAGAIWPYSVCRFSFDRVRLGGNLVVNLKGKNAMLLEAVAGNLSLGSNLYANGGDSSDDVGGIAILGGYEGVGGGNLTGNGPGASERLHLRAMVLLMADTVQGDLLPMEIGLLIICLVVVLVAPGHRALQLEEVPFI